MAVVPGGGAGCVHDVACADSVLVGGIGAKILVTDCCPCVILGWGGSAGVDSLVTGCVAVVVGWVGANTDILLSPILIRSPSIVTTLAFNKTLFLSEG